MTFITELNVDVQNTILSGLTSIFSRWDKNTLTPLETKVHRRQKRIMVVSGHGEEYREREI